MTDVQKLVEEISDLPTLPDVVARLNHMIADPNTSASDINDVISRDVSLSAKILKLVNSPYYGFSRRITTITYAVVILGFNTVRNLALSAFIFDAFKKQKNGHFDLNGFWRHSICTAIASASIAKVSKKTSPEDAFMAGILHGVGKVVMGQFIAEDLERVMSCVVEEDCRFLEAERRLLEYDHCALGGLLLERWNLPDSIVDAVSHHLDFAGAESCQPLTATVHVGNIFSRALCVGFAGDHRIPELDRAAWDSLELSLEDADHLMGAIRHEALNADDFLALA